MPFLTPLINRAAKKSFAKKKKKKENRPFTFPSFSLFCSSSPLPILHPLSRGEIQSRRTHPLNGARKIKRISLEEETWLNEIRRNFSLILRPYLQERILRASTIHPTRLSFIPLSKLANTVTHFSSRIVLTN